MNIVIPNSGTSKTQVGKGLGVGLAVHGSVGETIGGQSKSEKHYFLWLEYCLNNSWALYDTKSSDI